MLGGYSGGCGGGRGGDGGSDGRINDLIADLYGVDQKKVRAELFICFFVSVYCCFIQAPSINND